MLISTGGVTGIMFCHQTNGPITVWAYKREGLLPGMSWYIIIHHKSFP